ncbi:D-site 20S pre-rRNA nuclease, partial [Saccharata proteae CBS 121410]
KPIRKLVLDAGPIIKNTPAVSTLLAQSEELFTTHAVIAEIRDAVTRARIETILLPFLTQRDPRPDSVKIVTDFARRTGDLAVLSRNDIQLIALARELEVENNGGDWRLRNVPGQKRTNGAPPPKPEAASKPEELSQTENPEVKDATPVEIADAAQDPVPDGGAQESASAPAPANEPADESGSESEEDGGGWITPSNIKKQQLKDSNAASTTTSEPKTMQAAIMTTDFAMQNVILQMNVNLVSTSLQRVKHLKTFVLRCHACFNTTKDMSKQFCVRCGKPALTRVACSTDQNGVFTLHLKKNMQWNTRGDRYSIPKPQPGSSNGRVQGGGKGGWGNELILAEDQKEYTRQLESGRRLKQRDLMDEDYLPGILTGDRNRAGGRPKVGAGRNVNSRKR